MENLSYLELPDTTRPAGTPHARTPAGRHSSTATKQHDYTPTELHTSKIAGRCSFRAEAITAPALPRIEPAAASDGPRGEPTAMRLHYKWQRL